MEGIIIAKHMGKITARLAKKFVSEVQSHQFINHLSNVKLNITFHRLHLHDNEIIAEEQASFSQEGAPQSKYLFSGSFAWYSYINIISIIFL